MTDSKDYRSLVERLRKDYDVGMRVIPLDDVDAAADSIEALLADVRSLEDVLERAGFRRCDIPACNCGSWHQVGGFKARFDEIKEAVAEHIDLNGKTLLSAVQSLLAERGSFEALWRSTMDVLETERAERDAAVLAEREACAKVCENFDDDGGAGEAWASRFADAIRARGASDDQG